MIFTYIYIYTKNTLVIIKILNMAKYVFKCCGDLFWTLDLTFLPKKLKWNMLNLPHILNTLNRLNILNI